MFYLDMANSKSSSNVRNLMYPWKPALLPPKSPFPSVSSSYVDHVSSGVIGSKAVQKPRDGTVLHQRASSETFRIEEQPFWLDDLLNEPDTPVRMGGHRRSTSDSFAYIDATNASNVDYAAQAGIPSWEGQDFDYLRDARKTLIYAEATSTKQKHSTWYSPITRSHSDGVPSVIENATPRTRSAHVVAEADGFPSSASEKQDNIESGQHDSKTSSESKDDSRIKSSTSDTDTNRAKQQFAQRSRVRKLQYIAELERNVQALQAEGSGVSAELEFLNQRNMILSMENKALKQRLESLNQEQLIKYFEQEVLEKEIGRLRTLYQQQRPASTHLRSRDLDLQLGNLSLKHKDANSSNDPINGPLWI